MKSIVGMVLGAGIMLIGIMVGVNLDEYRSKEQEVKEE